jgi:RHS repeat-associated protein
VLGYEYDERGNVRRIPSVITRMDYDLSGRRSRVEYASGVAEVLTHDQDTGRLTSMELLDPGGSTLRSTTLTTDQVGNLTRIDSPDPDLAFRYTYDDLYRLVGAAVGTGETWSYRYDDAGALSHKSDVGDYAYGEGGAPATCLTTAGSDHFTYSPLGEMQQTPWGSLTFDAMGRLIDLRRPTGSEVRFRYDYAGERVAVETTDPGGPSTLLTPDALYELREGTLVANVFDGESLAARLTPAGALYLHRDHLGGLAAVTDAAGTLVQSLRYDPYGAVLERTGQEPPLPVGFTGGVPELLSGLLYLGARYYHPGIGRFISPDPVVQDVHDPIAWSSYVYCRDNPASYIDPTGRGFWGIFLASLAIVALVVLMVCGVGEVALAAVIVGMVVGGLVGGLAAAAKGGDTEDIVTGVFVGAAVGGWGAYLSVFAGAGASSALGINGTFIGTVTAGAINGTINGAAIGFGAGYAGGKGSLDEIWTQTWHGALVGAVAGAVLGGLSYALKPPSASVGSDVGKALKSQTPIEGTPIPGTPSTQTPLVPTSGTQSFQGAGGSVLSQIASKVGGVIAKHILPYVLQNPAGQTLIVDAAAGAWDLGYVPWLLNKIGVVSV